MVYPAMIELHLNEVFLKNVRRLIPSQLWRLISGLVQSFYLRQFLIRLLKVCLLHLGLSAFKWLIWCSIKRTHMLWLILWVLMWILLLSR